MINTLLLIVVKLPELTIDLGVIFTCDVYVIDVFKRHYYKWYHVCYYLLLNFRKKQHQNMMIVQLKGLVVSNT
jgi:hypothetical protein